MSLTTFTQGNIEFTQSNFKSDVNGFKEAVKKFQMGDANYFHSYDEKAMIKVGLLLKVTKKNNC